MVTIKWNEKICYSLKLIKQYTALKQYLIIFLSENNCVEWNLLNMEMENPFQFYCWKYFYTLHSYVLVSQFQNSVCLKGFWCFRLF